MREAELEELTEIKRKLEETNQALKRETTNLGADLADIEHSKKTDNTIKPPEFDSGQVQQYSQSGKIKGKETPEADSAEQQSSHG